MVRLRLGNALETARIRALWVLVVVLGCVFIAYGARGFEAVTITDYSGEELFLRFCASCHGESARGDGPVASGLSNVVPDLTTIARRYGEFPAARIRETIDGRGVVISAHGTRVMPVWGYEFWIEEGADVVAEQTSRETINRLVEYLRSIQSESNARP